MVKQTKAPSIPQTIGRQISMTAKLTREWADATFAAHDSSLVTWIVLKHAVVAEPPGFSQRELAEGMAIGGPALVRHLDRLEQEGLVERRPDPTDRRVTRVTITEKGRRLHGELSEVEAELDGELRSLMTEREAATLLDTLARIENHLMNRDDESIDEPRSETA